MGPAQHLAGSAQGKVRNSLVWGVSRDPSSPGADLGKAPSTQPGRGCSCSRG